MTISTGAQVAEEYVGYAAAAEYLGIRADTLSNYVHHGIGPDIAERRRDRQYIRPVFLRGELDAWQATRPGKGARTDLH